MTVAIVMALGTVLFGWVAQHAARGGTNAGVVGELTLRIALFPSFIGSAFIDVFSIKSMALEQRFAGYSGLQHIDQAFEEDGYLLLSRVNGDLKSPQVELLELSSGRVLHRWMPDIDSINALSNLQSEFVDLDRDKNSQRYRIVHPLLLEDGGIVFQDMSPLVKIDFCSNVQWVIDGVFHHSAERGPDGNFWVPTINEPSSLGGEPYADHIDDAISKVSPNGEVLSTMSVSRLLFENGFGALLYGVGLYNRDAVHLNDIQPALSAGKYWEKGDLLLSLRQLSTVLLYRPSENRVLWLSTGPWLNQHDPDFVGTDTISVFGNDVIRHPVELPKLVNGHNELYLLSMSDGSVSTPYSNALKAHDVRTMSEGLARVLKNGDLFIEETDHGRLMRVSPNLDIRWQFVNRAKDGQNYRLAWSRYLTEEEASSVLAKLPATDCGA